MNLILTLRITALLVIFNLCLSYAQSSGGSPIFKLDETLTVDDYLPNTIVLKVKSEHANRCAMNTIESESFTSLYNALGGAGLKKMFPYSKAPEQRFNSKGLQYVDLSLIYKFKYSSTTALEDAINRFIETGMYEYVEPYYVPHLDTLSYLPNDSLLEEQYMIKRIKADSAWAINDSTARGDTTIVIGITDTGIELTHPDLKNKIKFNYADTVDGIDNDDDGYIDNFNGWDLGDDDNDPTYPGTNAHGVHVAGIAAAETNNKLGVAGIGFNCKFLPIKISDGNSLSAAYEGITYAADHGCAIINCSWSGGGKGQLGQDIVNYATINKNALVVASSGNTASDVQRYPAGYNYAFSVANTRSDDKRSSSSTYNYTVDASAPGQGILSTYSMARYNEQTGTSMSSPCVAGAAAIVKSFFPAYTAMQIGERLKVTCDDIYPIALPSMEGKLGAGRINLYKALTAPPLPSIVMTKRMVVDSNNNVFIVGDTLRINGEYINYLAPTQNLTVTLSTKSAFAQILNPTINLGVVGTYDTVNNRDNPFEVRVLPNATANIKTAFKLTFVDSATGYKKTELFDVIMNTNPNIGVAEFSAADNNKMAVYPNPTSGDSHIDVDLDQAASVTLRVVDVLGNEVATIASANLQAGRHNFSYNTSLLSSGIYYYQLQINSNKYVQKLVVTK